ncbi:MAG: glycosyltransferase [Proteobacteria bacterium]|nr:glycosyltransferase [Pseudomonadota bacterium]
MNYNQNSNPEKAARIALKYSDITVILPTLNEVSSIYIILNELLRNYPDLKVIIVDDRSTDGTIELIKDFLASYSFKNSQQVQLLIRSENAVKGLTASVIEGIRLCKTKYFVVMDADLQHPITEIQNLVGKLEENCDLVVCRRNEMYAECPKYRIIFSSIVNKILSKYLSYRKVKILDPLSGFFAMKTELFKRVLLCQNKKFQLPGYKILFEILKILSSEEYKKNCQAGNNLNFKISEINFKFERRIGGNSKLRLKHAILLAKSIFA